MKNSRRAKIVVFEGIDGVGKTTQVKLLADWLTLKGFKVLCTKEPGTPHLSITQELRRFVLSKEFDAQMTTTAREFLTQAIRSIHLEKLIIPALTEYDFIIQDRGVMSGIAYGNACGFPEEDLRFLAKMVLKPISFDLKENQLYDLVIMLENKVDVSLNRTEVRSQEYKTGDVIEAKGSDFMRQIQQNFSKMTDFPVVKVNASNTIEDVFKVVQSVVSKHFNLKME
jgi:dTMP kinase